MSRDVLGGQRGQPPGFEGPVIVPSATIQNMAVAAVDPATSAWDIASFSSRGPTFCTSDGSVAIKPDIAAPGVDTYSASPGGSYSNLSGTSMASPHVNGAAALGFQANPDLEVEAMKQIIYGTATDLGSVRQGQRLRLWHDRLRQDHRGGTSRRSVSVGRYPDGRPEWLEPSGGAEIMINVSGNEVSPDPATATLHIVGGSGTVDVPMEHEGGDVYRAVFPELECGLTVNYFFSIESTEGDVSYSPFSAPASDLVRRGLVGQCREFLRRIRFRSRAGPSSPMRPRVHGLALFQPMLELDAMLASGSDDSASLLRDRKRSVDEDIDGGSTILTSPATGCQR